MFFLIHFLGFRKETGFYSFFRKMHKNTILIVFIASCNIIILRITQ